MKTVALFLLLAGLLEHSRGWENSFDGPLDFSCPAGHSISSVTSENSNYHEDRRWEFGCQATFGQSGECYWTNYVNDFDQPLLFECPAGFVMAGTSSYHNNNYEDRRWRFYCCKSPCVTTNCDWTSYVNAFDEFFTWTVPSRNVLVGAQSYHQNHEEDRRWRYKVCVQYRC
ncbi:hemagglutinin/amebocyte aggregation factor-like [Puntigrus tetrazona]|uniref:hemagglutinin/amebocyte aggregation factor-like n=1 Tax=Puntigrus tetrazona TaxID=1606681 RepID=UPI001C897EA0|nr:hemagglutinin/amebocyte aggregation factor-like [Puntigrus tetrazona]